MTQQYEPNRDPSAEQRTPDRMVKGTAVEQPAIGAATTGRAITGKAAAGGVVMVIAVVLLALNLRPAVNSLGVVMPELQASTGLSGTVAGLLLALPTLCFAVVGFAASWLAVRIGSHRTVLLALVSMTGGQLLRATVDDTWALFAGSILALAGIAIGNVLLPGLIRLHFPSAIGLMTAVYTTVLVAGQSLSSGVTLPIQHGLGGTWRLGIGMWTATAFVALVPWIIAVVSAARHSRARSHSAKGRAAQTIKLSTAKREAAGASASEAPTSHNAASNTEGNRGSSGANASEIPLVTMFRSRYAWAMAVFFGMQSLQAYVVIGWVPKVLTEAGMSQNGAGGILAVITAVGVPMSAVVPTVLARMRRPSVLVIAFCLSLTLGYTGLILIPTTATWAQGLLIGFGLSAFPMGLTLMALRARTAGGTTALSGFGQSVGYLLASVGPVGFGFLHDLSGGSTVPLIAMICTLIPMLLGGLVVVRDWKIEDDLLTR